MVRSNKQFIPLYMILGGLLVLTPSVSSFAPFHIPVISSPQTGAPMVQLQVSKVVAILHIPRGYYQDIGQLI